jgi:hypothetical protein
MSSIQPFEDISGFAILGFDFAYSWIRWRYRYCSCKILTFRGQAYPYIHRAKDIFYTDCSANAALLCLLTRTFRDTSIEMSCEFRGNKTLSVQPVLKPKMQKLQRMNF